LRDPGAIAKKRTHPLILKAALRLRAIMEMARRFSYFEDHELLKDTLEFHLEAGVQYNRKKRALTKVWNILLREYWNEPDEEWQDFLRESAEKVFHHAEYMQQWEKYHAEMVLFWGNTTGGFYDQDKPRFPNRMILWQ
jgi:hypothetical protein